MVIDFLTRFVTSLWSLLLDTGVWLVAGLVLAGVVNVLVPRRILAKHLAGGGIGPVVKASLLGIPLPLCSCSVIPVAAGLRGSGASKGASAAFAISTPQTGEESIPLTWALFGPVYALSRPVIAVLTAFTAGTLIDVLCGEGTEGRRHEGTQGEAKACRHEEAASSCCGHEEHASKSCCHEEPAVKACGCHEEPEPASSCCGHDAHAQKSCCEEEEAAKAAPAPAGSCCHTAPPPKHACCCESESEAMAADPAAKASLRGKLTAVLDYGFNTLLRDLSPWLAIGLLLSALISAAVPDGWIESTIGTGFLPMLLMLLVGLPLYVCATSTTPLAYTLVVAGLSPGAGLVLLLAGPATNAATMSWVVKDLGVKALVIYLATIAFFAVAGGWAFDAFLGGTIHLAQQGVAMDHGAVTLVQGAGAGLFAVLLLWALGERYLPRLVGGHPAAA
ncbi:MAG: SO_0444 family Cu/Zn efflux transporter [Phycisphaeraceae bacterium]|nr:MAG: SO_0444 family Cu/Zn efflux transporter [Phycisphaeraceae bacterium]